MCQESKPCYQSLVAAGAVEEGSVAAEELSESQQGALREAE